MRMLLWVLLALNGVAAVLWGLGFSVPATSRPEAPQPTLSAKRLELLSELPSPPARLDVQEDVLPPPLALADTPPAAPADDAAAGALTPAPVSPAAAPPEDTSVVKAASPAGDGLPPTESAAPSQSDAAVAPTAADQAPTVVSEESAPTKPAATAVNEAPVVKVATATQAAGPAAAIEAPDGPACFRTAAFAPDAQQRVEAALRDAGFERALVKSTLRPRYWVYWSGAPGAVAGVEQALKAAGVRDWYRVGGAREATISLGVYGQVDGARRRQRQLAANGVEAKVRERYAAQARLRWQISASPVAVETAQEALKRQGVGLEACR